MKKSQSSNLSEALFAEQRFFARFGLLTVLYVVFQLLALTSNGTLFFAVALVATVSLVFSRRFIDFASLAIPLVLIQHSYPHGFQYLSTGSGGNWIHGSFIIPISMVHLLTAVAALSVIWHSLKDEKLRIDKITGLFLAVLCFSTIVSGVPNVYELIVDFGILATVVVWSLYIQNVQTIKEALNTYLMLAVVPLAISWGGIILYLVDWILGTSVYSGYLSINIFVFVFLLSFSFERRWMPSTVNSFYRISTLVYGLFYFSYLQTSDIGSGTLIVLSILMAILLYGLRDVMSRNWTMASKTSLIIIIVASIYLLLFVTTDYILPLHFLVYKFLSVFYFDIGKMEHSAAVRVLELLNIFVTEAHHGVANLAFGKGIGGYFTDSFMPFENYVQLRRSDFSPSQLSTHHFYRPHSAPQYVLLKYGLLGIGVYLLLLTDTFRLFFQDNDVVRPLCTVILFVVGISFGFGIKNSIIVGASLGMLARWSRNEF